MPTEPLALYRWRYRDELTRKHRVTRYLATEAEARNRYGDRLIEAVPGSREARYPRGRQPHIGVAAVVARSAPPSY